MIITREIAKLSGLKYFFTGKPCLRGHVAKRKVCDNGCYECRLKHGKNDTVSASWVTAKQAKRKAKEAGLQRYFTGRPCKNGHIAERYVSSGLCIECMPLEYKKNASYYADYGIKNKDKLYANLLTWQAKNPDLLSDYRKRDQQKHGEARRAWGHKRRTMGVNNVSKDIISRLRKKQENLCAFCSADISKHYHLDHILSLKRGGDNCDSNLQLLCKTCNLSKGSKTMEEYADHQLKKLKLKLKQMHQISEAYSG